MPPPDRALQSARRIRLVSKNYPVGYGKPPEHARFKKGKSGNPAGRPRRNARSPHIELALMNALNSLVTVTENGKIRRITKFDAVITQLVNKAAIGDLPSIKLLTPFFRRFAETASEEDRVAMAEAVADPSVRIKERLKLLKRGREAELLLGNPALANNGFDKDK
jgi:hypothetical protein